MKRYIVILLTISIMLPLLIAYGCAAPSNNTTEKQVAAVERGDIEVAVTADGTLSMPHQVKLCFGTPGTVKDILVDEGDEVYAGKLLAKMDDTAQQIAIKAAQYDVEMALNELAEKIYPSLLGYPHYYPSFTSLLRVEQAQKELDNAIQYCAENKYADASFELRVMYHDLQDSLTTLQKPIMELQTYPDINKKYLSNNLNPYGIENENLYPAIPTAIAELTVNLDRLRAIEQNLEEGHYEQLRSSLIQFQTDLGKTHNLVDNACGSVVRTGILYPDASTSLSVISQVEDTLHELQNLITAGDLDTVKAAEKIRMALNDIEVSKEILKDNELLLGNGLNLKVLRQYNLNFQKTEQALQKAKNDLMQTEILASFDGTVVDIGVKVNEQLSLYDYATKVAVHLVDTNTVQIDGVIDEIDIFRVERGQSAEIKVDALPNEVISGNVTFVSPFSTEVAGIVNYPVTINIIDYDEDFELKGGLTATAEIIVDSHKNVLYIPNGALKGTTDNYYVEVMVDKEKDITEQRNIVIGLQNDIYTEIIAGLVEGEEVIVERVRPTKSIF